MMMFVVVVAPLLFVCLFVLGMGILVWLVLPIAKLAFPQSQEQEGCLGTLVFGSYADVLRLNSYA